jgi:uncharacterized damage-inducible protein DinB
MIKMSQFETARYLLDYMINKILPVLEKAIAMIPEDNLDYKPNEKLNTIKWLGYHALNGPHVYLMGVENTVLTPEIFNSFKIDLKDITKTKQLVEYSNKLKTFIVNFQKKLTENDVTKKVTFEIWEKWSQTGFEAIQTSVEEMIHHRGQLCTYLRLLGKDAPLLYEYL